MELPEGLLKDIKNYLDITWIDAAGDEKLSGMILRGMSRINQIGGAEFDFTKEDLPRELLFTRVMYERANALDDFGKNYLSELNTLQNREAVKKFAEKENGTL